ncbi:MAG: hypothetical protein WD266_11460 [Balneolales bacterium]
MSNNPINRDEENYTIKLLMYLYTLESIPQHTERNIVNVGLNHIKGYFKHKDDLQYIIDPGLLNHAFGERFEGPDLRHLKKIYETLKIKKIVHCLSGARTTVSSALLKRYEHNVTFVDGQFSSGKKAGHKILTPNIR